MIRIFSVILLFIYTIGGFLHVYEHGKVDFSMKNLVPGLFLGIFSRLYSSMDFENIYGRLPDLSPGRD